ncbi:hypothetical protein DLAC_05192 [Tieghemostelium lacteum]|uniref:DNA2/NAM7 helicase-like C-terminal domain-containing protein n=1 Tax=Tieghemostelium lacteum TaxID=361077 RepID=A0A151ZIQ6_TIELA|nr:hypothetical protein DLAC_05192 [Tieghemostelium lacteum]|eukprot:KYQ93797.1 hypothetical protein DLAC_05192 [Tieghemostelium lacteum]
MEETNNNNTITTTTTTKEDDITPPSSPRTPISTPKSTTPTTSRNNSSSLKKGSSNLTANGTPKKTLRNFVKYGLIKPDYLGCYFQYKTLHIKLEIVGFENSDTVQFKLASPKDQAVFIEESSATTLIKKYLTELNDPNIVVPKTFEGNKYLYVNHKRLDEYSFESVLSAVVSSITTPTNVLISSPSTPNLSNNNNLITTPGPGETPYKIPITKSLSTTTTTTAATTVDTSVIEPDTLQNDTISLPIEIEYEFQEILEPIPTKVEALPVEKETAKIENAKIKASGIGRYFHFGCDRYLSFSSRSGSLPLSNNTMSLIQSELIQDGFRWENKVLDYLEQRFVEKISQDRIFKPVGEEKDLSAQETLRILSQEKGNFYMFQSTLEVPPSFKRSLPDYIQFSVSKPDYLRITTDPVTNKRTIQIQDAKSTNQINFSQKIQLAFYHLLLNEIIKCQGLQDQLSVSETAGIYLKDCYELEEFSLTNSTKILEEFLFGSSMKKKSQILEILGQPKEDAEWTLTERCDGCEFMDICTSQASKEKSINSLANVDHMALRTIVANNSSPDSTYQSDIEILSKLKQKDITDRSLQIEFLKTQSNVKASIEKKVIPTGLYDYRMTSYEDIEVYIQILHHPLTQKLYQWSVKIVDNYTQSNQYSEDSSVQSLIFTLNSIFNTADKSDRSLQVYLFDTFERSFLYQCCFLELRELNAQTPDQKEEYESAILNVLKTLLYNCKDWINMGLNCYPEAILCGYFPMKKVYQEDTSPLLIKDLVKKSLVLSDQNPMYTFEKIVHHMGLLKKVENDDKSKQAQNSLSSDHLFSLIQLNTPESKTELVQLLDERLDYCSAIIKELKDIVFRKNSISKVALPFQIRNQLKYKDENLKRLYFCYQQENLSTFRKIKAKRSQPLHFNLLSGDYLQFEFISSYEEGKHCRVLLKSNIYQNHLNRFSVLFEKLQFNSLFLIQKDRYNDLLTINDNAHTDLKSSEWMQQILDMDIISKDSSIIDPTVYNITMRFKVPSKEIFENVGQEFVLFDTFNIKYWQMHKSLLGNYSKFDKEENSLFLSILKDPKEWITPQSKDNGLDVVEMGNKVKVAIQEAIAHSDNKQSKLQMTPSQDSIFQSLIQRRLQLILGPPGTGKTHFLALVVLIQMEIHKRLGKPFKVAITSHTHTAIDNLLLRIATLKEDYQREIGVDLNFHLTKHQSNKTTMGNLTSRGIKVYDKKETHQYLCLGSTCWGLGNMTDSDFDLLIIDEASQLNSYIGILAFNRLNPDTGRVLVCGDSKQLGPVLGDLYSQQSTKSQLTPDKYLPKVHKSVFSCLKSLLKKQNVTPYLTLSENFRMNQELCQFSAGTLYGPTYRCYSDLQSQITVPPKDSFVNQSALIKSLFDNTRACHTILLDPTQFGNKLVECEIVKQIYLYLNPQTNVKASNPGANSKDIEQEFWNTQLGVITPLHEQRNQIIPMIHYLQLNRLSLPNTVNPVVNTVETIQGQEFNNIVLCYNGFSERNRISEFSFNLNRLNVGFTRSKQRFILIVSEKLLYPDEHIFNNKNTSVAYNHLVSYIQSSCIHRFNITSKPSVVPTTTTTTTETTTPSSSQSSENDLISELASKLTIN